jgi:hypothetical protein
MVNLLTQYFIQNKELLLPGVGYLKATEEPARYDGSLQQMLPPEYKFKWQPGEDAHISLQPLLGYISRQTQWPEEVCFSALENMVKDIKASLEVSGEWQWPHMGKLVHLSGGKVGFVPNGFATPYYRKLQATRVVRKDRTHQMLVGDKETDTLKMQQELYPEREETTTHRWWVPALILGTFTLTLIIGRLANWW